MKTKKENRLPVCETGKRRGSISQLNPREVYHGGSPFVKRRFQYGK